MVTGDADREGCSPEMTAMEKADGFKTPAGKSKHSAKSGRAVNAIPGIKGRIELDRESVR
jgi:hypothetical protein